MSDPYGPKAELDQKEDDGDALVSKHPQEQESLSVLLGWLVEQLPGRDLFLRILCRSVSGGLIVTVSFLAVRSPTVMFWTFRTSLTMGMMAVGGVADSQASSTLFLSKKAIRPPLFVRSFLSSEWLAGTSTVLPWWLMVRGGDSATGPSSLGEHKSWCVNRYLQVLTGTYRYLHVLTGTYRYLQVLTGTCLYLEVLTGWVSPSVCEEVPLHRAPAGWRSGKTQSSWCRRWAVGYCSPDSSIGLLIC